jgi:DNA-binding response OmpR family regulator
MTTLDDPRKVIAISRRRALVVANEQAVRDLLRIHLEQAGFETDDVGDGAGAIERTRRERFDLIVLDRMVGNVDGITLCRAMRALGHNTATPIVMLAADGGGVSDRALGLESGADDCLARPFDAREFLARVRAVVRRASPADEPALRTRRIHAHGLVLDPDRRSAIVRGTVVDLTGQEFDLLYTLASRPGIVFSRAALVSRLCRRDRDVTGRTIDTMVSRLRRKIERDASAPELILTAWGAGYKFADIESERPGRLTRVQ